MSSGSGPELPKSLGGSWQEFVSQWCGGHPPGYEPATSIQALSTVEELWPEAINPHRRGLHAAAALIELGRLLSLTCRLTGFAGLLRRLKVGNQGAHSELIVAGSLLDAGREVVLGVQCGSSVLDLGIIDNEKMIYVEVVAPVRSEQLELQSRWALELGMQLDAARRGFSIAIQFLDDPRREDIEALVPLIPRAKTSDWIELNSAVRYRRWPSDNHEGEFEIEWPGIDRRAEKIIRRKCEQLSRDVPNILVIEMSAIGGSVPEWLQATSKLFQPTLNRRLGAVVMYESLFSVRLDRGYRLWWVIENPYALVRIPAAVLKLFASFDEQSALGDRQFDS